MNIYVGNLNFNIEESELQNTFEKFGVINEVRIIKDRVTGRSKGYGFLEIPNDEEATKMISELNGTELSGRQLVVRVAQPRPEKG